MLRSFRDRHLVQMTAFDSPMHAPRLSLKKERSGSGADSWNSWRVNNRTIKIPVETKPCPRINIDANNADTSSRNFSRSRRSHSSIARTARLTISQELWGRVEG